MTGIALESNTNFFFFFFVTENNMKSSDLKKNDCIKQTGFVFDSSLRTGVENN